MLKQLVLTSVFVAVSAPLAASAATTYFSGMERYPGITQNRRPVYATVTVSDKKDSVAVKVLKPDPASPNKLLVSTFEHKLGADGKWTVVVQGLTNAVPSQVKFSGDRVSEASWTSAGKDVSLVVRLDQTNPRVFLLSTFFQPKTGKPRLSTVQDAGEILEYQFKELTKGKTEQTGPFYSPPPGVPQKKK